MVIDGKAGYIDEKGLLVIPPQFNSSFYSPSDGDFYDGLAVVFDSNIQMKVINESGRIIDFGGMLVGDFSESFAIASQRDQPDRRFIVAPSGKVVASVEAHYVERFSEGLAAFTEVAGAGDLPDRYARSEPKYGHKRGYLDRAGKIVIPASFAYAGPFSEGLAAVALDGSCWVEQGLGEFPAPSALMMFTSCGPRPAKSITSPCQHGYIDKAGRMVIPARFELAHEFSEGRSAVRLGGKWGFIDRTGALVVPARFDAVKPFSEGKAAVRLGDMWGYVDPSGKSALGSRYEDALSFSSGLAAVKTGDHYCYVNDRGEVVIPGPYIHATQFVKGLAHVQVGGTKWAWITPSGEAKFVYNWKGRGY